MTWDKFKKFTHRVSLFAIRFVLVFLSLAICFFTSIGSVMYYASKTHGPFAAEDLARDDTLRLYTLNDTAQKMYGPLDISYYYQANLAEVDFYTYFVAESPDGEPIRVAKMINYIRRGPPNRMERTNEIVDITWASRQMGWVCKIPSEENDLDIVSGPPYTTCISWSGFYLFTTFSQEETIEFVNALVPVPTPEP